MGKVGNDERGGFGAMPFGLPRKGCGRKAQTTAGLVARRGFATLRTQPLRGNVPHEKILNWF
jgi:hypothetical protein